jgi:chromosome partitioning protein
MTAKVIAVANMKGGVGKTTMVVGLAETLAAVGANSARLNVLVVDLDAQANASYCIAGDDLLDRLQRDEKTVESFLKDSILRKQRKHLEDFIRPQVSALTVGGEPIALSLVAASPELRYVEREIIYGLTERKFSLNAIEGQVRELIVREIEKLRGRYEVIIFDCPPGISAFTEAVLKSSDLIIAPVIPDNLSTLGLKAFCNRVLAAPRADRGSLKLPWVLANRVQNTTVHKRRLEQMRLEAAAEDRGFMMFKTEVAQSAAIVAAMEYEQGAPTYANKYGDSREPLQAIAREAMEAIDASA